MHWFIQPIQNQYADFTGRTARKEFWMYILFYFIFYFVVAIVASIVRVEILEIIYSLALMIPSIAITTRRLHDINKSGWWQLIGLVPIVGLIVMIVFTVKEGDAGANQYGPSPLGVSDVPEPPGNQQPSAIPPAELNDKPPQPPQSDTEQ